MSKTTREIAEAILSRKMSVRDGLEIAGRRGWQPMDTAPRDRFILLWCPEDQSRWLAKWQDGEWYGVDDQGLTRPCGYHSGSGRVTGWEITHWMELPEPPL